MLRGKLLQLLQEVEKATGDIVLRGSSQADPESISKYIKTIAKLEELKGTPSLKPQGYNRFRVLHASHTTNLESGIGINGYLLQLTI